MATAVSDTRALQVDPLQLQLDLSEQLKRYLRPVLEADLQGIAARSGTPVDTLRKLRRGLRKDSVAPSPSLETLVAVALVSGLSLDAIVKGCVHAVRVSPDDANGRAKGRGVARPSNALQSSAGAGNGLPTNSLRPVSSPTPEPSPDATQDTSPSLDQMSGGKRPWEVDHDWPKGLSTVLDLLRDVQFADDPQAVLKYATMFAARVRRAPSTAADTRGDRWDAPHTVTIERSDSWRLACTFLAIASERDLRAARGLPYSVVVRVEIAPEEVVAARATLSRPRGRGAGVRSCTQDEVAAAFRSFLTTRAYPCALPYSEDKARSLADRADMGLFFGGRVLRLIFGAFCEEVGLAEETPGGPLLLGAAGRGAINFFSPDVVLVRALWGGELQTTVAARERSTKRSADRGRAVPEALAARAARALERLGESGRHE